MREIWPIKSKKTWEKIKTKASQGQIKSISNIVFRLDFNPLEMDQKLLLDTIDQWSKCYYHIRWNNAVWIWNRPVSDEKRIQTLSKKNIVISIKHDHQEIGATINNNFARIEIPYETGRKLSD